MECPKKASKAISKCVNCHRRNLDSDTKYLTDHDAMSSSCPALAQAKSPSPSVTLLPLKSPQPLKIWGDFNCHSPVWFNQKYCTRSRLLEKFIGDKCLNILNSEPPILLTYRQDRLLFTLTEFKF
ncbi:hypothetical protein RUM43_009408 [Polyplax serrata]|uniref:Endonuclease/exonuclease/phosphatase domain-containing protein n=1 Tax=Polyplax serrata TaxID=468196 RepID=A0AAN8NZL0_POLSC